jgi:DNA-binding PadR family transcriptional regulator
MNIYYIYALYIKIKGCLYMYDLTKHEEILLISILHLKENAYGVYIRRKIKQTSGKQWNYGTLYRKLDHLVIKGLLVRKEGIPMPEKGGRRKKYYSLTKEGINALQEAYTLQKSLWGENTKIAISNAS